MPEANVYILTRPLNDPGSFLELFGDAGKHWALIVEFTNGSGIYLCEITSPDVDIPTAVRFTSQSASGAAVRRLERFNSLEACKENKAGAGIKPYGSCHTTYKQLYDFKRDLIIPYHLITSNCQKYVEELIRLLNVQTFVDDSGNQACLPDCAGNVAAKVAVGVGIAAVVGFGLSAIFNRNSNRNAN